MCSGLSLGWLALLLIREKLRGDSQWQVYLDILPESTDSTVFRSEEELAELQEKEFFVDLKKISTPQSVGSMAQIKGIFPSSWSKSCLIPLADLINHSPSITTEDYAWEIKGAGHFSMDLLFSLRSPVSVKAGQQVLIQYDLNKSNAELALDYGFIESRSDRNAYTFMLEISESKPFFRDKLDIAETNGLGETAYFDIVLGRPLPPALIPYLRLVALGGTNAFLLESIGENLSPLSSFPHRREFRQPPATVLWCRSPMVAEIRENNPKFPSFNSKVEYGLLFFSKTTSIDLDLKETDGFTFGYMVVLTTFGLPMAEKASRVSLSLLFPFVISEWFGGFYNHHRARLGPDNRALCGESPNYVVTHHRTLTWMAIWPSGDFGEAGVVAVAASTADGNVENILPRGLMNGPEVLSSCTEGVMDSPEVLSSCTVGLMDGPEVLSSCTVGLTDDPEALKYQKTAEGLLKIFCTVGLMDGPEDFKHPALEVLQMT
ncbi:Ribulose-1,5 bisphosphate carboxylase/oxygenase large subunit N-methyltransferase [Hibiscus syriacus]|uniref:Ribulose-1,5 bisphosphate carboxylase/oxygenase large subunit N-methyltransferase n=1 Tax=Hibiscus syriacus TaxID=106335 RepID=A0A6A2X028_HIBSY|nr:Ribulose-1,5 bisphosphate carboxylase/oxygenase large subunit N-methyltransferase [Hibiscus syriacus]